jgi:PadR family transcriptional regulator PadR
MKNDSTVSEIKKGLLVVAVLQAIGKKKSYAAEILEQLQNTEFSTLEGTLYPLLSKLKREGLIDHEWIESKNGPPRKYYCLSQEGKDRSKELMSYIQKIQTELTIIGESHE